MHNGHFEFVINLGSSHVPHYVKEKIPRKLSLTRCHSGSGSTTWVHSLYYKSISIICRMIEHHLLVLGMPLFTFLGVEPAVANPDALKYSSQSATVFQMHQNRA
jgi:hypothetical protein